MTVKEQRKIKKIIICAMETSVDVEFLRYKMIKIILNKLL